MYMDNNIINTNCMAENIESKQLFLRSQILQAGIDPSVFLEFLVSSNPTKGEDLERWSMEQLKAVVEVFKENIEPPAREEEVEVEEETSSPTGFKGETVVDDGLYIDSIPCEKKIPSSIMMQEVKINLTGFQKISGGVFGRDYVVYFVERPHRNLMVKRRYSDFSWLRETFMTLHPGYPIPPITKKKNRVRYDDKYLTKKMYILEKFINKVLTIEQLATDEIFEKFLTISDSKQFQKYKNKYSKIKEGKIHHMQTLSGKVNVTTEAVLLTRIDKLEEYFRITQPQTKKIYKNFKGVATSLQSASDSLEQIAGNCHFLKEKEDALRNVLEFEPLTDQNPLVALASFASGYSRQLLAQAKTFRKQIYSLMKYQSYYKLNMIESLDTLRNKQKQYEQNKIALLKKKEKLYGEKVQKWNYPIKLQTKPVKEEAFPILLPKQTQALMKQREGYGLYCSQFYQESSRQVRDNQKMVSSYLMEFLELQLENAQQTAQASRLAFKIMAKIDMSLRE